MVCATRSTPQRRAPRLAFAAALAVSLAVGLGSMAAPAGAASVSVNGTGTVVRFDAALGETNALSISGSGTQLVLTDPAASITGCPASGPGQVTCTISPQGLEVLLVTLGDRDDRATVGRGFHTVIEGGFGDDRLVGGTGAAGDELFGGVGDDTIEARGGSDFLAGEAGADVLRGGDQGDSLDGGFGDDRVIGDAGDDFLLGGAGDDTLFGGAGIDRFEGLTGRDLVNSRDGQRETAIACGLGLRDQATADANDRVSSDCERVAAS